MSVDEQETDSVPSRWGGEAPEQQRAIATDDQREVPFWRIEATHSRTPATSASRPSGSMTWDRESRVGDGSGNVTSP